MQLRYWKRSRVLLIFLNEVISLIFGPWSKTILDFGTSSLFSLQQLPGTEWKLKNGITLILFPLFLLHCLASASVPCCLQMLSGNGWNWWQRLHVCYRRDSLHINSNRVGFELASLLCVISQNREFFWSALAARYKPNLKGEFGNVDFSCLQYKQMLHLQIVFSWGRNISYF